MGHADLWKEILELIILHEDTLSFQWVPLHLDIHGNEEADALAEKGRLQHPYNFSVVPGPGLRLSVEGLREIGLEAMDSGESEGRGSSVDSGGSSSEWGDSTTESEAPSTTDSGGVSMSETEGVGHRLGARGRRRAPKKSRRLKGG